MTPGMFTCWLGDRSLPDALDLAVELELPAIEIGTGGYPGDHHCRPSDLLRDQASLRAFRRSFDERGLHISALSCQSNPLHPDEAESARSRQQFRDSVLLAAELGVRQVVTFAGCPGAPDSTRYPNWITTTFPADYAAILEWQWRERVIPFWLAESAFCARYDVRAVIEPHPGFVVYNTATCLRLRDSVGPTIGFAYDPSHLFWQQMDPLAVVDALGESICHVHLKDTVLDDANVRLNGLIDTTTGGLPERSWVFRTIGAGHDASFWQDLIEHLRAINFTGALSIEAEDPLITAEESIRQAATFLTHLNLACT